MKKKNKFLILLIVFGVLLFSVITYVVVRSTSTVTAVVANQNISPGTKIEESMLKVIEVPTNTPKGYITDKSSLVGQKLKSSTSEDQLLYINNVMSSWDDFSNGTKIPEDYVITSIQLPSDRAVGGLITAGDTVDILGVPNTNFKTSSKDAMENYLGDISKSAYGADGLNVYWVISNVRILETDSKLSESNESSISSVTKDKNSSNDSGYYIVALSYDDYKKLRLSEQYLDLWMNISPEINAESGPLLDKMKESTVKELKDAQKQSSIKVEEESKPKAKEQKVEEVKSKD